MGARFGPKSGIDFRQKRGIDFGQKRGIDFGPKRGIDFGQKRGIDFGPKRGIDFGQNRGIVFGQKRGIDLGPKRGWDLCFHLFISGTMRRPVPSPGWAPHLHFGIRPKPFTGAVPMCHPILIQASTHDCAPPIFPHPFFCSMSVYRFW